MQTKTLVYVGGGVAVAFVAVMLFRGRSAPAQDTSAAMMPSYYGQSPVSSGIVGASSASSGTDPIAALMAGDLAKTNIQADTQRMALTNERDIALAANKTQIDVANIGLTQATRTALANSLAGVISSLGGAQSGGANGIYGPNFLFNPDQGTQGRANGMIGFDQQGNLTLDVSKSLQQGPKTIPFQNAA